MSHAAISHHVKVLEGQLGIALFERRNRAVHLTDHGRMLAPVVTEALDSISTTLDSMKAADASNTLTVTLTPVFAAKWLVPRLGRFHASHPAIGIRLEPSLRFVDFSREPCDVGVRCGLGTWPGLVSEPLFPIDLVPVCSPSLINDRDHPLRTPEDLRHHTLIHADVGEERIGEEWTLWLKAAGVSGIDLSRGVSMNDPILAFQAAVDGVGVAIGYTALVAADIAAGRLVAPFDVRARHPFSYFVVHLASRRIKPNIGAFREWLVAETQRERRGRARPGGRVVS